MAQTQSAASNLQHKVERLLSANAIVIILATLLIIVLSLLSRQKLVAYFTLQQEIQTLKRSQANTTELLNYVTEHQDLLSQITAVFPNENTIEAAYQSILSVAQSIDPQASLKLKSSLPGLLNQKTVLPMELHLSASSSDGIQLLRRLERLPLIIEIISLEHSHPLTQDGTLVIKFRLYVDDQFVQP